MFKKKRRLNYDKQRYFTPSKTPKVESVINENKAALNNKLTDSQGLSKAYEASNKVFVDGNKMYIAGTANLRDVWDDVSKIPFWGDLRNAERYQQAEAALKDNPQVDTVIGHSLGSMVGLELNKQSNNRFKTITYGAPVLDFSFNRDPNNLRYRHPGDVISMWDTGAVNEPSDTMNNLINPHSYSGYPDDNDKN